MQGTGGLQMEIVLRSVNTSLYTTSDNGYFRSDICLSSPSKVCWTTPSSGASLVTTLSCLQLQTSSATAARYSVTTGSDDTQWTSLQIYADKAMTYSLKGSLQDLDIFQVIQLFLTPICTIFSFAFTVPLVLKVNRSLSKSSSIEMK